MVRYAALILALAFAVAAGFAEVFNGQPSVWGIPATGGWWAMGFGAVGFVIAGRQPENPIGWLLLVAAVFAGVNGATNFTTSDEDLNSFLLATVNSSWVPAVAGMITALALLPDGKLPSPRWRPVVAGLWVTVVLWAVVQYGGDVLIPPAAVEVALQVLLLLVVSAVAVRFRRSRGAERQQLKWIAYVGGVVAVTVLLGELVFRLFIPELYFAATVALSLGILAVPVAIAMAILRYRLYDIDRIISRTVAYGTVTAALALTYVGVIFLLRLAFPGGNQLVVAATTLAVAALFNPFRRRVQVLVDQRFNRIRYDAVRVAESFGSRLRSRNDIQAVANDLLDVITQTMEPASTSLWFRDQSE